MWPFRKKVARVTLGPLDSAIIIRDNGALELAIPNQADDEYACSSAVTAAKLVLIASSPQLTATSLDAISSSLDEQNSSELS